MNDLKRLGILVLVALIIIVGGAAYYFGGKSDNKNLTLGVLKDVAKLATVEYNDRLVKYIDENGINIAGSGVFLPGTSKYYIMVITGSVTAGIDLDKISKFSVDDGVARIELPKAEILSSYVDPKTKIEKEYKGMFTDIKPEEITQLEKEAENDLIKGAKNSQLLERADRNAKKIITQFVNAVGIKKVVFE